MLSRGFARAARYPPVCPAPSYREPCQCLPWVISGHRPADQRCPLLSPKADMFSVEIDVCFVPIADIEVSAVCFSYLISQVALWLTIQAARPPTVS
jgi:hypothetical protein